MPVNLEPLTAAVLTQYPLPTRCNLRTANPTYLPGSALGGQYNPREGRYRWTTPHQHGACLRETDTGLLVVARFLSCPGGAVNVDTVDHVLDLMVRIPELALVDGVTTKGEVVKLERVGRRFTAENPPALLTASEFIDSIRVRGRKNSELAWIHKAAMAAL